MQTSGPEQGSPDLNSDRKISSEDSASIDALAAKLDRLERARAGKKGRDPKRDEEGRRQSYSDASRGMKMATEFVCAVMIGAFLGWLIDRLLGTLPLFMLLFFVLGAVSGFLNAYRAAIGKDDDRFAGYELFGLNRKAADKQDDTASGADKLEMTDKKSSQAQALNATGSADQKEGR